MPRYVDGFVIPVPKSKVKAYQKIASLASKVWKAHGALEYRECVGDDLRIKGVVPMTTHLKTKPGETIIFAWIVYKSRAHRDKVNAKVMKDRRITSIDPASMPFDMKRMLYGGFKVIVDA